MEKILKIIDKETNQPWTVKILEKGDAYGRDNCLTHDDDKLLVEFYDGRYIENFDPEGQFVSRYYVETILEGNSRHTGLNLHGGVDSWSIGYEGMNEVRDFLRGNLPEDKKFQKIQIIHRAFEDLDEIATVAEVTVNRGADLEANINFAWRVTQNIEGSWSRDKYMPSGELNDDYNPWVKTIAPLKVDEDGKEWGHRSTSIGDVYVLDTGEAYVVNSRENRLELVELDEILKLDGRSVIRHLFN